MGTINNRKTSKDFRLDTAKIKFAKKPIQMDTANETNERTLHTVISEHQRNRITRNANARFVKTGIKVRDVYGKLAG